MNDAAESSCEKSGCCSTSEDGNALCVIPQNRVGIEAVTMTPPRKSTWQTVRGGAMFMIACLTSPCCTPLIVPLALAALAGTPAALWLGDNLGWVYGGLTLLSAISFVLAWRWLGKRNAPQSSVVHLSTIPVRLSSGDKAHVE